MFPHMSSVQNSSWLMISSGIILSNIGIMRIQERGIPNSSNQDSMEEERDFVSTAQVDIPNISPEYPKIPVDDCEISKNRQLVS